VDNLTHRLRGSEAVAIEVESRDGKLDSAAAQRRLEQVAGVSRVVLKQSTDERAGFEVESLQKAAIRGDLARAVVESGWNLNELRPLSLSLEEIFLELTGAESATAAPAAGAGGDK